MSNSFLERHLLQSEPTQTSFQPEVWWEPWQEGLKDARLRLGYLAAQGTFPSFTSSKTGVWEALMKTGHLQVSPDKKLPDCSILSVNCSKQQLRRKMPTPAPTILLHSQNANGNNV